MSKSMRSAPAPLSADAAAAAPAHGEDAPFFPLDLLRARADRLARMAAEACRLHQQCAKLAERDDADPAELLSMLELTAVADRLLGEAATAYEKAGTKRPLDGDAADWWRQANALWLAAREHVRRHSLGDRLSKRAGVEPSPGRLTELHVEFSLEASALLSLRQAAEAYCRVRPVAL